MTPPAEHAPRSGFDKLARLYRWMEYASFGPLLQRTRCTFLPTLGRVDRALVLGDGDGRFCAELLRAVPGTRAVAVDRSAAMLRQLQRRADAGDRLHVVHGDALACLPPGPFDLICTHFFLDCLIDAEVQQLAAAVRARCDSAVWLVSEFAVPARGAARLPAWLVVAALYRAFGLLTGLRVRRLPDYAAALERNGFVRQAVHLRAFGLLRAERWHCERSTAGSTLSPLASNQP